MKKRGRISSPHRVEYVGKSRRIPAAARVGGAADHAVSEAIYLRDPDENGVELYRDRPECEWPRAADGSPAMYTARLDVEALVALVR